MKTLKTVALCAVFASSAAFADDVITPTEAELDSVRSAIASIGCVVDTEESASAVETATGFNEGLLQASVDQLRVYEEIVDASDEGGIKLVSGNCEA